MRNCVRVVVCCVLLCCLLTLMAHAGVPQLMNYQGILLGSGDQPVTELTSVVFTIYDDSTGGNPLWTETQPVTPDVEGRFSILLGTVNPLADTVFSDPERYLGIAVAGDPEIEPRARLSSVPWAHHAATVVGFSHGPDNVSSGNHTVAAGDSNTVAGNFSTIIGGTSNTVSGNYSFMGSGSGNVADGDYAVVVGGGGEGDFDTIAFALTKSPATHCGPITLGPNWASMLGFVGGGSHNTSSIAGVIGGGIQNSTGLVSAVVGGYGNMAWGTYNFIGGGGCNRTLGQSEYAMIGGGHGNETDGLYATVGGGECNEAIADYATISGGGGDCTGLLGNVVHDNYGTISGGSKNTAGTPGATNDATYSTVGGGSKNVAFGEHSTIGGGEENEAARYGSVGGGRENVVMIDYGTVGGGDSNKVSNPYATIGGGLFNRAMGDISTISGGDSNTTMGLGTTIGGGDSNVVLELYGTIGGGSRNLIDFAAEHATIGGGFRNTVTDSGGTIAGGDSNTTGGHHSYVGGGLRNTSSGRFSTNGGGRSNTASGDSSTVSGGAHNSAGGLAVAIGGGFFNRATHDMATVSGGQQNLAGSFNATVGGGAQNRAQGNCATVPGGQLNVASGNWSFAAGQQAQATHAGAFVWSDNSGGAFASTAANEFRVRAAGGINLVGTLSKTAGSFRIDHPLDPLNKYLSHSFVESPDMMNIYNGNVTLDANGEAEVEMPEWFGALNRDFRYQLTCIGGFAPVYIAEKVSGNRFMIAGGKPGMEVSWQVTGIRQDPYAQAHPISIEEEKPPAERGTYLYPELYEQATVGGTDRKAAHMQQ